MLNPIYFIRVKIIYTRPVTVVFFLLIIIIIVDKTRVLYCYNIQAKNLIQNYDVSVSISIIFIVPTYIYLCN